MAIEMAREAGAFFSVVDFMSCITVAKQPCYGQLKMKRGYNIVCYYVLIYLILWRPADINECRFGYQWLLKQVHFFLPSILCHA
jgi:hypothetical protein